MLNQDSTMFYIIPIIDPWGMKHVSYAGHLARLKDTLNSILFNPCGEECDCIQIIVVMRLVHSYAHELYHHPRVTYVTLEDPIFPMLRQLDGNHISISRDHIPSLYKRYLTMRGAFHNKDKGLKYFLGLYHLYRQYRVSNQDFVALVDGDDFVHHDLHAYLLDMSPDIHMVYADQGYLMDIPNHRFQEVCDFSNICGSNRFFRALHLRTCLESRLGFCFDQVTLGSSRHVTRSFIYSIMKQVKKNPRAWNILPTFLGMHRVWTIDFKPTSQFQYGFNIHGINFPCVIKRIHHQNHSSACPEWNKLLSTYENKGILIHTKLHSNITQHDVQNILSRFGRLPIFIDQDLREVYSK